MSSAIDNGHPCAMTATLVVIVFGLGLLENIGTFCEDKLIAKKVLRMARRIFGSVASVEGAHRISKNEIPLDELRHQSHEIMEC